MNCVWYKAWQHRERHLTWKKWLKTLLNWSLASKMIKSGQRFGCSSGNLLPSSLPPSHHHCQIPQETHLKSHVHSLITLSLVREREAKGDRAKPRAVDCSGLIAPCSAFVVAECVSVCRSAQKYSEREASWNASGRAVSLSDREH